MSVSFCLFFYSTLIIKLPSVYYFIKFENFRSYSSRPYSTYSRHYEGKVTEAVEQMIAMGFTDDDGWLTQLCTLKKGNIEQVLDVLTPVKK